MIRNIFLSLTLLVFMNSCSKKTTLVQVVAINAITEDTLKISIEYKEDIEIIEYENHIQMSYPSKLKDSLLISLRNTDKCKYMEWEFSFSSEEILEYEDDTLLIEFVEVPLYHPVTLIFREGEYFLDSTMIEDLDIVCNTIGEEKNYGVEVTFFYKEECEAMTIIANKIKEYIVSRNLQNKNMIIRFIKADNKSNIEVMVRPLLICP